MASSLFEECGADHGWQMGTGQGTHVRKAVIFHPSFKVVSAGVAKQPACYSLTVKEGCGYGERIALSPEFQAVGTSSPIGV